MVAHPKLKRTIKKGLRPFSQDEIAPTLKIPAQKMKEWAERLLTDNNQPLTKKETYVLLQIKKAAERLVADTDSRKQELLTELNRLEDRGHRLKFSSDDIWGMNAAAILIRKEGWIEKFIQQTEDKLGEIK